MMKKQLRALLMLFLSITLLLLHAENKSSVAATPVFSKVADISWMPGMDLGA